MDFEYKILDTNHSIKLGGMMVGVSPAFVISAYSPAFTVKDYLAAAPRVAALGFEALQLELYRPEAIGEWTSSACSAMRQLLDSEGLAASQFVAHFALADFASAAAIRRQASFEPFLRSLEIAESFPDCPVVTLPIPAFDPAGTVESLGLADARSRFVDLLRTELEAARAAGKRLALEIMPYSLVGGTEGFLRLRAEDGLGDLAYNFDTGHVWACKERVELVPALLGDAIAGTHLCDNRGHENLKLRPGAGSLDFRALLSALAASGYRGSLDLEILCAPEELEVEYLRGRDQVVEIQPGAVRVKASVAVSGER